MPYVSDENYCEMVKEIDDLKPPFLCIQDASSKDDGLPDSLIVKVFEEFDRLRDNIPSYWA